ncbi:MAG: ABC transporter permease [Chloroflexi bacterium]|jgi:ABC-2 type transport system permease protein|nr:ABC transporter permease [Anaerolineaceae bacterium]NMB87929.1 ABC transporter permease [Chloroflexota bacterium]
MERLWTIMRKELYHIWRDPRTLGLILVLPALLLLLLGFGVSAESENLPMAVADLSKTDSSRRYVEYYSASKDFQVIADALSEEELLTLIDSGQVQVGLLIPADFGRKLDTGETAAVQLYVNGSADPTNVQTIQLKLSAIGQAASQNILVRQVTRSGTGLGLTLPIESYIKTLYNPNGDRKLFMIPGLIPVILELQALLLSALAIVKEREQGTMEQLIVTTIKPWELMLGKIIPYLLVSLFTLLAMLGMGKLLFGISVAGSFWELIGVSLIFIIGSLGMGVLISNISQSQMQAVYMAMFLVLIPSIILSGMLFPRDNMPWVSLVYSELLPVTQYLNITRAIFLRGVSAGVLWRTSILPMILLSIVYFAASVMVFRKRI